MDKKIKIAHVITRMDWAGSTDIVRLLCANLDRRAYDVTLIYGLTQNPTQKTQAFLTDGLLQAVCIPELRRDIHPFCDFIAFLRLWAILRKGNFDLVHTHTAKAGVLGRLAAFCAGATGIIHTPHGHNFYGYFGPALSRLIIAIEKSLSRITTAIIALTELEQDDLIRLNVAPSIKVHVIYQGLELQSFADAGNQRNALRSGLGIGPDNLVVGFIGRLEPIKGLDYFIQAGQLIIRQLPNVKFLVVGEGSLGENLKARVSALGYSHACIFTGWRQDIPEMLSAIDVLVLPSLNEAVGIILIEAQAAGVAVVATRVGGIPAVVLDDQTGILVEPANSAALASAVIALLQDTTKRLAISTAAKVWVQGKFQIEDMVQKVSLLYQETLREAPRRSHL